MTASAWSWSLEHDMVVRRTGSGRELVWIHGLGEQSASFDRVVQQLPGFTHVLPDLLGYGRSRWPVTPPSIGDVVEILVAWLGDRRPILAGHSLGGVFAQLVAERVAVAAVIDIDGNLSRGDCKLSADAAAYSEADFVTGGFDAIRDAVYRAGIDDLALRGYHAALRMASPHVLHRHARELVELSTSEELAGRLAKLAVPLLYIAGSPGGACERSRALLDEHGVRWAAIAPAGHWPFIDQPAAFADQIRAFTATLRPGA